MRTFKIVEYHHRNRGSWDVTYIVSANSEEDAEIKASQTLDLPRQEKAPSAVNFFTITEIDISELFQVSESD